MLIVWLAVIALFVLQLVGFYAIFVSCRYLLRRIVSLEGRQGPRVS